MSVCLFSICLLLIKLNMLQMENHTDESPDLYIGVTKRRKYCIESEKMRLITSLALHGVIE